MLVVGKGVLVWAGSSESMYLVGLIDPGVQDEISLETASARDCHSHRGRMQRGMSQSVQHWSQGHSGKIG